MGFLRRLFGGASGGASDAPDAADAADAAGGAGGAEEERARERDLLRADAERLSDPLLQRQLRYADRAWTPPPQGGERRAGETGAPEA